MSSYCCLWVGDCGGSLAYFCVFQCFPQLTLFYVFLFVILFYIVV